MWRASLSVTSSYFTSVFWIDVALWKLEFLNIKGSCNPETFLRDFHTMQKWFSCCCTNVHFNGFNGFKRGSKGGIQNLHFRIRLLCFEMSELWMCGSISKLVLPGLSKEVSATHVMHHWISYLPPLQIKHVIKGRYPRWETLITLIRKISKAKNIHNSWKW